MGLRDVDVVDYTSEFHVVFGIVIASMNDLEYLALIYHILRELSLDIY